MTDDNVMEVQMVDSSSDEEGDPTQEVVTFPKQQGSLHSPSKQDSPMKVAGRSDTIPTVASPKSTVMPVIRPSASSGQSNGSVGIKTTLGSPAVRYISPNVRNKWTNAVNGPPVNQVQRNIIATTAGQASQMITSSGTGSSGLSMIIGVNKNASYVVTPSAGVSKTINLVNGNLYLNTGADGPKKIVCSPGTSIVTQQDGRIINPASIRPLNVINQAGAKVFASSTLGTRCITANQKLTTIRGAKPVVITKPTTQLTRPQGVLSRALISVSQPVGTIENGIVSSISTGASSSLSTSPTVSTVVVRSAASAGLVSGVKINNCTPAVVSAASNPVAINAVGTVTAGANEVTVTCGEPCTPGVVVTAGLQQQSPSQSAVLPETKSKDPENRDTIDNVDTTKAVPDSNMKVETKNKIDFDTFNSQNSTTSTSSDGVKSSSDILTITDDSEEVDPPEKKLAIRKATILSGTKPKLKTSLLSGVVEGRKLNLVSTEMTSLIAKSSGGAERTRKRKDNHKAATVDEPPQKSLRTQELEGSYLRAITGAEDLKAPTNVIKWDGMGLGMLPGSTLRFTKNVEGMLEVHEPLLSDKMEFYMEGGEKRVKPRDTQEIYCCIVCSCYGLLSEFNTEVFCSNGCLANFNSALEKISTKLLDEPLTASVLLEDRKTSRRKIVDPEGDDKTETPPVKQKKSDDAINNEDSNQESVRKIKQKVVPPQSQDDKKPVDEKKPMIKLKSMEFMNASGRQLRARENPTKKPLSKFVAGQDLEGEVSDDDEKIQNENADPFPWTEYLVKTESKPAWVKMFQNPNPSGPNPFKIGFKLEAIDPERQGLFCAATVADVQGHRLKIHFDGYSNKYDFWTNIDSPNIFECGFCERQNINLQPPFGMKKVNFNWATYQASRKVRPCHLSWFRRNMCTSTNMFRPGMKLEAVDKKNTQLTCVATCIGVLENRILVHFDSWSDVYDYWVDTSSPYIHPVGWCKSRNRDLMPPNYYNAATFSWDSYLKQTKSEAAPHAAFTLRPPIEWKKNTKLEAIDKRAPHLLRVATIKEVLPYQIKIVFDGFPEHFGYWVDDDCADIHPINWGLKTGHQVSAPPEPYQILNTTCPTPGCIGDGNWNGLQTDKHSSALDCPYSNDHLNAESPLQDRMADRKTASKKKLSVKGHDSESDSEDDQETNWKFLDEACERSTSKGRLSADGTFFEVAKVVPHVLPAFQVFKGAQPAVLKSGAAVQAVAGKLDDVSGNQDRKPQGRRLERRGSDRSLDSEASSQERKFEGKGSDKNLKVTTRRSLPVKTPAGVQAGSPLKCRASDVTSTNSDRLPSRKSAKGNIPVDPEFFGQTQRKASVDSTADILTWNYEQCAHKMKDLPPKCQASLKKYKVNGERFLMLTNLLRNRIFADLSAAESKSLHNTVTLLHTQAVTGLDVWKPVKANSKYGNTSQA